MTVTRCVCFDTAFADIWAMLRDGKSLADVHAATGCGGRCGLCIPYILAMLKTGKTELPVMWKQDFESLGVRPTPIDRVERRVRESDGAA